MLKPKAISRAETRRQEARRLLVEQRGTVWQRVTRQVRPTAIVVWGGFYLAILAIMLVGEEAMPWRLHEEVANDITARVAFGFEDKVAAEQQRQELAALAPDVYVQNPAPLVTVGNRLTELLAAAKAAGTDAAKLKSQLAEKGWSLNDEAITLLQRYSADPVRTGQFDAAAAKLVADLKRRPLVQEPAQPVRQGTPRTAILRSGEAGGSQDTEVVINRLQYVSDAKALSQAAAQLAAAHFAEPLRPVVSDLIVRTLGGPTGKDPAAYAPLWRYDPVATLDGIKQAQDQVKVKMLRREPGDLLVRAGTTLSSAEMELLAREHKAYLEARRTDPVLRRENLLREAGVAMLVLAVTLGIAAYSSFYQRRIPENTSRCLSLALLMAGVVLCSRFVSPVPEFAVGFLVVAAMLVTIAYNQRFAFGASGALAILVTLACDGEFGLFLSLMAGMGASVFALREVRTRSKIVGAGLAAAVAAFVASSAANAVNGEPVKYILEHATAAGGAALFAGFIVQGILPHFERLFGIATSMTLLEWCDASQPLLRRLAQVAPGTYTHSLILSQMCEEAAVAIGANGLLARVGALYHDIGKTQKPDYFVENQEARMSRHSRLSPTMSLLIITGHVKDGLEMARAYGLPRILHQFIREHHGSTVVKYFHHQASEAAAKTATGRHDREVSENEFRYPGPKPRTPESAILMLCDGCEGAVRAIAEPAPGRIETTVHQVVMARLTDGQFDECDITMKDLRIIEQSMVKSLCALHHGRIKYPSKEPAKEMARRPGRPDGLDRPVAAPLSAAGAADDGASDAANGSETPNESGSSVERKPAPEVARQA